MHSDSARSVSVCAAVKTVPANVRGDWYLNRQRPAEEGETWARWIARQTRKIFRATPMPELTYPVWEFRSTHPTELTGPSVIKISNTSVA